MTNKNRKIVVIVKGWPRLSETFIAQELLHLENSGLNLHIVSLRQPTGAKKHTTHDDLEAPVLYLPEYPLRHPIRVLKALFKQLKNPNFLKAATSWIQDLKQELSLSKMRRFFQALVLATEIPEGTAWIYVHFLHTPSSVALYTSQLLDIPFSFSAHAKDIWTIPKPEIRKKLDHADWGVTCTKHNLDYLQSLSEKANINLLYHGVRLITQNDTTTRSFKTEGRFNILTIARAVEKKGLDLLIKSLSLLPQDIDWHWTHIGDGPLLKNLKKKAHDLNLDNRIDFLGPQTQDIVFQTYKESDLFILPCRITDDGDRDGLPNVLLEAHLFGVPCLSTQISGVGELIHHNHNGYLIGPDDYIALTHAIETLYFNPSLRQKFSEQGRKIVKEKFSFTYNIQKLIDLFEDSLSWPKDKNSLSTPL